MDYSAALGVGIAAVVGLWALLFLPPWLASRRERRQFEGLERQRRRQYARVKHYGQAE